MTINKKEDKVLIAVYGSLRKGLYNHHIINDATYIGHFTSQPRYTMYDLGSFPALMEKGNTSIEFEVYAVNEETARKVDRLEGYTPGSTTNHYEKTIIHSPYGKAYIYVYTEAPRGDNVVESGDWIDYQGTSLKSIKNII